MHLLPILALADASGSAFDQMLRLIGIAAIIVAIFKGIQSLIPKPSAAAPAVAGAPPPAVAQAAAPVVAESAAGITPEILAILAAAVASITPRHRIIAIKSQNSHWEKAGRQSVLSSHRIR